MRTYRTLSAAMIAAFALSGTGSTLAFAAGQDDSHEYARLEAAKVSLSDAIAAAEKAFGGKAVSAALDQEQAEPAYEVELMTADGSKAVAVNGLTGQAAVATDTHDGGDNEGGEDTE